MSIKTLPLQLPYVISPADPAAMALSQMLRLKVNHIAVCEGRRVVGLIGIGDILKQLIPAAVREPDGRMDLKFAGDSSRLLISNLKKLENIPVGELLQPVVPLDEDCPLLEAAMLLFQSQGPLAVVDAAGNLKGMLSRRVLIEHLSREAENSGA